MKTTIETSNRNGFTIADTAIALTIMGCILCVAVLLFAQFVRADQVRARQTAQELCSICYEAHRAGVDFAVANDVDSTLQNLLRGGEASSGRSFKAAGMTSEEAQAAVKFLRVENGVLTVDLTAGS